MYTPSPGKKRAQCLAIHPHPQTHHTYIRGQARFGNEAPPEAQGVNSCTEGCVLWSQHLRRLGQRRKGSQVLMDQKKENGER